MLYFKIWNAPTLSFSQFSPKAKCHGLFRTSGKLAGNTLDIKLTGALVGGGKVDVTGNIETVTAKADISSSGVQAASTRIRGKVKYIPQESKAA